jgi:hypothetical protein
VSWTSPWSEDGGDCIWSRAVAFPISPGSSGSFEAEIFKIVDEWENGELDNYGILLTMADTEEYSLRFNPTVLTNHLSAAEVVVEY